MARGLWIAIGHACGVRVQRVQKVQKVQRGRYRRFAAMSFIECRGGKSNQPRRRRHFIAAFGGIYTHRPSGRYHPFGPKGRCPLSEANTTLLYNLPRQRPPSCGREYSHLHIKNGVSEDAAFTFLYFTISIPAAVSSSFFVDFFIILYTPTVRRGTR